MGEEIDTPITDAQHQPTPQQPLKEEEEDSQQHPQQPVKQESQQHQAVKGKEGKSENHVKEEEPPPPASLSLPSMPPPPPPLPLPSQSEKGQMVCGSCRQLLSYPLGSKHVKCSCCQTVNYVLEEHQVGQVMCGNCQVLLMYPYGALSVRCCSCSSVIYIGDHNKRPPLSVQQSQACRPFKAPQ